MTRPYTGVGLRGNGVLCGYVYCSRSLHYLVNQSQRQLTHLRNFPASHHCFKVTGWLLPSCLSDNLATRCLTTLRTWTPCPQFVQLHAFAHIVLFSCNACAYLCLVHLPFKAMLKDYNTVSQVWGTCHIHFLFLCA